MNDEEYFEQLCSNSVDGTLTDSEREKLEAHLAECPSCAALLRDLREMRALFAQEAEAPDSLHDGIMEQLRQETKLHVVQPEKPVRRMPVFTMVGVAAAVVLVVLGGGLMPSFSTVGNGSSGASADAGDAVAAVTADSYSDDAGAASDGAAADIAEAAENAGVNSASRSVPETAVQGTSDIAAGGSASGETAPQTAAEEDTPSVFSLPRLTQHRRAERRHIRPRDLGRRFRRHRSRRGYRRAHAPRGGTRDCASHTAISRTAASCPSLTANCCIQTAARHGSSSTTTCLRFRTH